MKNKIFVIAGLLIAALMISPTATAARCVNSNAITDSHIHLHPECIGASCDPIHIILYPFSIVNYQQCEDDVNDVCQLAIDQDCFQMKD